MRLSMPSPKTTCGDVTATEDVAAPCVAALEGSAGLESPAAPLAAGLVAGFFDRSSGGLDDLFGGPIRLLVLFVEGFDALRELGGFAGGGDCFSPLGGLLRGEGIAFVFICTTGRLLLMS